MRSYEWDVHFRTCMHSSSLPIICWQISCKFSVWSHLRSVEVSGPRFQLVDLMFLIIGDMLTSCSAPLTFLKWLFNDFGTAPKLNDPSTFRSQIDPNATRSDRKTHLCNNDLVQHFWNPWLVQNYSARLYYNLTAICCACRICQCMYSFGPWCRHMEKVNFNSTV